MKVRGGGWVESVVTRRTHRFLDRALRGMTPALARWCRLVHLVADEFAGLRRRRFALTFVAASSFNSFFLRHMRPSELERNAIQVPLAVTALLISLASNQPAARYPSHWWGGGANRRETRLGNPSAGSEARRSHTLETQRARAALEFRAHAVRLWRHALATGELILKPDHIRSRTRPPRGDISKSCPRSGQNFSGSEIAL